MLRTLIPAIQHVIRSVDPSTYKVTSEKKSTAVVAPAPSPAPAPAPAILEKK